MWFPIELLTGSVWIEKKVTEKVSRIEYVWGLRTDATGYHGHAVISDGSLLYNRQISGLGIEFLTPSRLLIKPMDSTSN